MTDNLKEPGIISDANVLIDYAKSTPNILKLVSKHVQQLYVATPVLREVAQLEFKDIEKLGIEVVEPKLSQIIEAAQIKQDNPSLSGQDAICFIIARDSRWVCLTNDKLLRTICSSHGISCVWGLEIMLRLVSTETLSAEKAYKIALDIQSQNHYITTKTLQDFKKKLGI